MFSWSLATDSRPPGTRITLTDTKRRWQKHRFERCLPGLLVSNTSKWIKLSPIKYLTALFSFGFSFFSAIIFSGEKIISRQEVQFVNITQISLGRARGLCYLVRFFDIRMGCTVWELHQERGIFVCNVLRWVFSWSWRLFQLQWGNEGALLQPVLALFQTQRCQIKHLLHGA